MKKILLILLFLIPLFVIAQAPIKTVRLRADSIYLLAAPSESSSTDMVVIDPATKKMHTRKYVSSSGDSSLFATKYYVDSISGEDMPVNLYSIGVLGEIDDVVTAGYQLVHLTLINNSESTVTAKLGWTSGGSQLLDGEEIPGNGWIDVEVARMFSLTTATSLWIASEDMQDEGFTLLVQLKKYITE